MNIEDQQMLIRKYFEENNFVKSNIDSYDSFIKWRIQEIISDQKEAIPAVIPPDMEDVRFRFGEVFIKQPTIIEADGAERMLLPTEARLRNLSYNALVYIEVSLVIDGKERDRAEVQIAEIPVMVRSGLCYLNKMNREELIKAGEDPGDPGGYFIIDGTERVLVLLEDLAPNHVFTKEEKVGPSTHSANVFSASESYRIPLEMERSKDGLFLVSFSGIHRVPFVVLLKALGIKVDKDILETTTLEMNEDMYINFYEFTELVKTQEEAQEFIAKTLHLSLPKDRKLQRVNYILNNLLLPHLGKESKNRNAKAAFLGRMVKKILLLKAGKITPDDKDHYMNKRVRLAGDLLEDLFRTNFKVLVNDMLYIFQRGVRRGRLIPITSIVRTKLLTQRIKSAMATGKWTANRQGVSQRLERDNPSNTFSHLRRVVSLLESNRESFKARELHPTHWGRLCPLESPEGKNIGLRKNLAILAQITPKLTQKDYADIMRGLEKLGLEMIK